MKKKTPLQAIKSYCLSCMCGSSEEVKLCTAQDCSLYLYRLGIDPARSYTLSDENRALRHEQGLKLADLNRKKKAAQVVATPEQQK